jgi:hypothetical protein
MKEPDRSFIHPGSILVKDQSRSYQLDLQRQAKTDRRITSEYLKLYALEGFLLRLANSDRRNRFVLKGGVLLAAYELRRPTADIDFAALPTTNDVETIRQDVIAIASTHLPVDLDDGLIFDLDDVTALVIRDQDQYSGVRVRMAVALATARERFHIDVNVGDPIWPAPSEIQLPRLLPGRASIALHGYPMEMVLAEKTVTALQLGIASTRWRDFGDIYQLSGQYPFDASTVRRALEVVSIYRKVELAALTGELDGYASLAQSRWVAWRARHDLSDRLPQAFQDVIDAVTSFADPLLTTTVTA